MFLNALFPTFQQFLFGTVYGFVEQFKLLAEGKRGHFTVFETCIEVISTY